ncbi:hypothetical protein OE88DRAFT_1680309 [Heliocybe sulcata]|uniref:Transcription factor TFIIIC triple barrel domain-containing protein n=1 Tax=Heliocybe sulcata TaxID=5364 RepID=A0A5C3NC98_9AGAM|nr:hypothetical protein OE88DRAFT_1680309 [Heliocybe sulcata]
MSSMSDSGNTSLFPGFREVQAFGPDEEYEDEEEVSYVALDMGSIDPTLLPSISAYRLIGLDTPTPFVQLGGSTFRGRHHDLLGTELFFTDDDDPSQRGVKYVGSSERRICFKEVQLRSRQTDQSTDQKQGTSTARAKRTVESVVAKPKGRPGRRPKANNEDTPEGTARQGEANPTVQSADDGQPGPATTDVAMDVDVN